jgi:hypothetical protein
MVKIQGSYTRKDLGLTHDQWDELKSYVNDIELALDSSTNPPRIVGEKLFQPGPWVGNYDDLVTTTPQKVTTRQYKRMIDDVASSIHLFTPPLADTILPKMPDRTVDAKAVYPRYSQTLLTYSEELLAGRLPVRIQREMSRGFEFDGSPDLKGIINERARNSPRVVSRKTKFTFDTLENHLLYEFHRQLATNLSELIDDNAYLPAKISKQHRHHINFLETTMPVDIATSDANPDLRDPTILAQIRSQSSGVMMEIVDLWEIYLHQRAEIDPFSSFATAIKPIYEVFEVWCLHKILEILEQEYGPWNPNRDQGTASRFAFEEVDAMLYYDTSVSAHSRYVANEDAFEKRESGRPDFLFVLNDEVQWLADAKFQDIDSLDISGIQRFLGYLVDFIDFDLEETPPTALLGIGSTSDEKNVFVEGVQVNRLSLMTDNETEPDGLEAVRDMITND